jgi:hypothetical protein
MHGDTLSAGIQLAGRYRIEDLVGETASSQTWRAVDRILNRSVSVQVVSSDDPASEPFLTAARRATAVEDPRFLRVLDAAHENGYAYVVREWASGVSLDTALLHGPLPTMRAVDVMREVAEAVAAAHRSGVHHRQLDPSRVIIKHNGAVRLLGLATDHALRGDRLVPASSGSPPTVAETEDVVAIGRLLYACLVARWPGGRDLGLPAAPTEHGRLLRPRQVRAGIDPAVDAVCDRLLHAGAAAGDQRPSSAAQVARDLGALQSTDPGITAFLDPSGEITPHAGLPALDEVGGPPPAVTETTRTPPTADRSRAGAARWAQQSPAGSEPAAPRVRRPGLRPVWVAVALLVAIALAVTFLGLRSNDPGVADGPDRDGSGRPAAAVVDIAAVEDFDPLGNGEENPGATASTYDGDPTTTWTTQTYFSELSAQKEGVGLLIDLGGSEAVSSVDVELVGTPTTVELYAATDRGSLPASVDDMELVDEIAAAGTSALLRPESDLETRYLVLWLTELPPVDSGRAWRGEVAELTVRG